jgi:hypothetical protein
VWRSEVGFADRFVAEAPDLDVLGNDSWRGTVSLRWVLMHMVEEYARHNGQADLLRERIDGAIGLWPATPTQDRRRGPGRPRCPRNSVRTASEVSRPAR